ncbi:MAG: hypothetical protein EP297_00175 [Gammaproteobacteria bacterium]|nr:MAG: hypothetical protein EP297_00175 [Gammaproteobacteria bacterium]
MTNQSKIPVFLLVVLVCMLVVSCASTQPRPTEELILEVKTVASKKLDKTLSVLAVQGGEKTEPSIVSVKAPKVDDETFFNLLYGTLKESNLFKEVTSESHGDYALRTEIIFQDITLPGRTNTLMLLVHYELSDREYGQVLWKENIYTQLEMSTSDVSAGEVRVVRLLEKGLIANMDALIKRLENYLIN